MEENFSIFHTGNFLPFHTKNLPIHIPFNTSIQCRRYGGGGQGGRALVSPHFGLLKILFLEHHVTARQQTILKEGIIMFKHNSR